MDKKYSKEQIFDRIVEILISDFELDKEQLTPQANMYEDLDLDSIDAVDLAVRLQQFTDKKISPEEFKKIHTLEDVVNVVYELI